jgi:hypothetical protein
MHGPTGTTPGELAARSLSLCERMCLPFITGVLELGQTKALVAWRGPLALSLAPNLTSKSFAIDVTGGSCVRPGEPCDNRMMVSQVAQHEMKARSSCLGASSSFGAQDTMHCATTISIIIKNRVRRSAVGLPSNFS